MITEHEEHEGDQDSLFGSPPPSPRISAPKAPSPSLCLPSASTCDSERRLSTSTDTQNVGTIALPGSHPNSELPINPLALSLNHGIVHRPPAQSQNEPLPISSCEDIQPPPASARPPTHFLRNQENLLGKAGLVAGVRPTTIKHIRGATPSNPIIIDDEDTPILSRQSQSRDTHNRYVNPALLTVPTNEDIVSVLIGQKNIFPVLKGILGLIGNGTTRHIPTPQFKTRDDYPKPPPVKRRKLNCVPAGATDWDVPYPFQEGDGPDEYHKTWERERGKQLIAQLVKLIKDAARKAATKNYLRKEQARQAAWEQLRLEMIGSEPIAEDNLIPSLVSVTSNQDAAVASSSRAITDLLNKITSNLVDSSPSPPACDDQSAFNTWMTFLQAFPVAFDAQPQPQPTSLAPSQDSTPGLDDFAFMMGNAFDFDADTGGSSSSTVAAPDDLDALVSSMLNSLPQEMSPVPSMSSCGDPMTPTTSAWEMSMPDIFMGIGDEGVGGGGGGDQEGGGWDEVGQITRDSLSGVMTPLQEGGTPIVDEGKGKGKEVLRSTFLDFLSNDATPLVSAQNQSAFEALAGIQSTDIVPTSLPSSTISEQQEDPGRTLVPRRPSRPKSTISQPRKEEILRRAREKRQQVREELDRLKTQLWESTIEQAALVHLLKRYEDDENSAIASV